jgi:D-threo-aldose 1-dehydrogenase
MTLAAERTTGVLPLPLPRIGLGTAAIGGLYDLIPETQSFATVQAGLAQGWTLMDTAPLYGAGESERRLGNALADVPRDHYLLASKVGRIVQPDGSVVFDYSRNGIQRSIQDSLNRLKLKRIDILHLHDPDQHFRAALDSALPLLVDLRRQGVIAAVGVGMNQWKMLADFVRNSDLDCVLLAGRYTLLEQTALPLLELCRSRGVQVFLGGIYNSGILATGARQGATFDYAKASPDILDRVSALEKVAASYQVPLRAAALQFAAAHPAVTSLLIGARSPQEVFETVDALRIAIPAGLWADLRNQGLLESDAPTPSLKLSQVVR